MRPAYGTQPHIILQRGKRDKLPHIFLISPARFQVRDVRQPFLFEWNIGELLELRGRQAVFFKRHQIHCSLPSLNTIIDADEVAKLFSLILRYNNVSEPCMLRCSDLLKYFFDWEKIASTSILNPHLMNKRF